MELQHKVYQYKYWVLHFVYRTSKTHFLLQVNQLLQVAQKCQSTISESGPDGVSQPDLQANSVMVVTAGRQLAKSLELQSLNDLGFSKRYVRCLQIAEVVNSMKSLMDFCRDQKVGPIGNYCVPTVFTSSVSGLQNVPATGFSNSHVAQLQQQQQQHVLQRSLSGNGLLLQNQPQPSHGTQISQQQTIQQLMQDVNSNGGGGVQQQSLLMQSGGRDGLGFRNSPSAATTSSANGQGNVVGHPPSRSNSFKSASNNFSFSQKVSDLPQNLHLSEEMVQDIAHESTENGFFNSELDDSMNYVWK
ncbi:probable transcriptional regulator SLK1 [Olea europaea var. sylvestris]|uniref:probable transcriptional regulator SLK1 n=1 Tax=Olea europaea var. sylvestris TaxID=158386 RepID=UPI000C1D2832|nr:probable transcriptional regulator SLK1 [Olea europaea var. sylvestris]